MSAQPPIIAANNNQKEQLMFWIDTKWIKLLRTLMKKKLINSQILKPVVKTF